MKTIKVTVILFFFFGRVTYSQNICTYYYVLNERLATSDSISLFGMEQEFSTKREYFNTSSFSETRLFTGNTIQSILFKIENGIWYYNIKNKWKLFYDFKTKNGGYIFVSKRKTRVQFKKVVSIRNEILHEIILEPMGLTVSHNLHYYFSPSKGVIIIKASSGTILLRKDSFETPLTEEESDVL